MHVLDFCPKVMKHSNYYGAITCVPLSEQQECANPYDCTITYPHISMWCSSLWAQPMLEISNIIISFM